MIAPSPPPSPARGEGARHRPSLLALFIFIPGLYVVTNLPRVSGWVKAIASLGYVAVSGALGVASMVLVHGLLRG